MGPSLAVLVSAFVAPGLPVLPAQGFALESGHTVVLRSASGTTLVSLPRYSIARAPLRGSITLRDGTGRLFRLVAGARRLMPVGPASPLVRRAHGCQVASAPALLLCAGDGSVRLPQRIAEWRRSTIRTIATFPPRPAQQPNRPDGHWVDASSSWDGRTILAQWSGECESPSAVLVDRRRGSLTPAGGSWGEESFALGWLRSGGAAVDFPVGVCGATHGRPGVYAVSTDGRSTSLVIAHRARVPVAMWGG